MFRQWLQQRKQNKQAKDKTGNIQRTFRIIYDIIWNVILFFLILGFIGGFFVVGIGAGYFASLVKDEELRSAEDFANDIYNYEATSKLYFADNIYLGDVRADLHREEITLSEVSETLIQAVIATEDEYFLEHKGVVPKAIIRALYQEVTNADLKTGGSTLTQQLIKNQILTNEVSFERKAKEILLALRMEHFFDKDEILEAYLNVIPYGREASGRNIAGIQTAAQGVFGVNADEVNLPQAAYLAGLPQSPSAYTPFKSTGGLKSEEGLQPGLQRMKVVLKRMYDLEYITKEEYEEALAYDIVADFIEEKARPIEKYGYVIDEIQEEAKDILFKMLVEESAYSMEDVENDEALKEQFEILANRELRTGGYHIHSTIDKEIYDAMQQVVKEYQDYGPDRTLIITDEETGETIEKIEPVQVGASLIENSTGRLISFVGGREYSLDNEWNYATKGLRPNGSTMKPLLVYAPAMELGYLQPGSPVDDSTNVFDNPGSDPWVVGNFVKGRQYGIISAREALARSHNIHAAKAYMEIISEKPAELFLDKMGFSSLKDDYPNPSLSLGGAKYGVTVEENTNAFATFGNYGQFVKSYIIEKITDQDGNIVYEHEPEPVEVFSPQTAYLTIDMMRDVVQRGTATFINSQLKHRGVDWAGKTGTSNDFEDAWFVGLNPNVTLGIWIGYDTPYDLQKSCQGCSLTYSQRANKLWAQLINVAGDINPELIVPTKKFERPEGIVSRSICAISGMLPSDLCKRIGLVRTDIFNAKYVPTEVDDSLIEGSYVLVDGQAVIAGPNTPEEFVQGDGVVFNPEFLKRKGYDKLDDLSILFPNTQRELWEKIGIPSSDLGEALEDDGAAPKAPTSLKASGNKLTWNKSSSSDVVGYRIYYASEPDGKFEVIGTTTKTEVNFTGNRAVFYVTAVDYFGLESEPSNEIIVGKFTDPDDKDEKDDKDKGKKKPKDRGKDKHKHDQDQHQDQRNGNDNDNSNNNSQKDNNGNTTNIEGNEEE